MAATDFQSLLSSPHTACYLNAPPGMQRLFRLALLESIANQLSPSTPTDYESLLESVNVPCCISEAEDRTQLLRLALLQDIVLTLGTGGGGTSWLPSTPGTLVEWLKADAITLPVGSHVADWPNSHGFDATVTGASNPMTVSPSYTSLPVVRFNVVDDGMSTGSVFNLSYPYTVAIVFNPMSATGIVLGLGSEYLLELNTTNFAMDNGSFITFGSLTQNQLYIMFMVFNGSGTTVGINGGALTAVGNPGNAFSLTGVNLMPAATGTPSVDVGEVIIWSGDGTSFYPQAYQYLLNRWG